MAGKESWKYRGETEKWLKHVEKYMEKYMWYMDYLLDYLWIICNSKTNLHELVLRDSFPSITCIYNKHLYSRVIIPVQLGYIDGCTLPLINSTGYILWSSSTKKLAPATKSFFLTKLNLSSYNASRDTACTAPVCVNISQEILEGIIIVDS